MFDPERRANLSKFSLEEKRSVLDAFDTLPMYLLRLTGPQRDQHGLMSVLRETIAQFDVRARAHDHCA